MARVFRSGFWFGALCFALSAACVAPATRDPRPLLDRIAYGPATADTKHIRQIGATAFIEEQLHPETIDDSAFEARLTAYPTLAMSLASVRNTYGVGASNMPDIPMKELIDAKILRSVYSRRQLEAILTDFWINHFNVRDSGITIGAYERDVIRPHVLGRFEDLLVAVARSPAMELSLNNVLNVRDGIVVDGVAMGGNENFSRELMELHTVGVESGYTQQDVIDLARCFTGWSIDWNASDGFAYVASLHETGAKQVMGLAIPAGGGEGDGRSALHYLATHPSTAARIARKLVRRFVDENPPESLVQAATDTFLTTGGDLREVMRTILLSDEFLERPPPTKVKRPLVLVASLVRALGLEIGNDVARYRSHLGVLGEVPYGAPDPRGYPDDSSAWLAPGSLLNRLQFIQVATRLAGDAGVDFGVTGSETAHDLVVALATHLALGGLTAGSQKPIEDYVTELSLLPHDRVVETAAMVLSTPEFLFH